MTGSDEDATGVVGVYVAASGGNQPTATGCIVDTNYKFHKFTGPGTFTVTCAGNGAGSNTIDYLVVAGGGSGASRYGGAGGAGGYRESPGGSFRMLYSFSFRSSSRGQLYPLQQQDIQLQ